MTVKVHLNSFHEKKTDLFEANFLKWGEIFAEALPLDATSSATLVFSWTPVSPPPPQNGQSTAEGGGFLEDLPDE